MDSQMKHKNKLKKTKPPAENNGNKPKEQSQPQVTDNTQTGSSKFRSKLLLHAADVVSPTTEEKGKVTELPANDEPTIKEVESVKDVEQAALKPEKQQQLQQKISKKKAGLTEEERKKKEEAKRQKRELMLDPVKIVASVLEKSSYVVPNLSKIIEEKMQASSHYSTNLKYPVTVKQTLDGGSDVSCSVFPTNFQGTVNVDPASVMILPCVNTIPKTTRRWGNKRKQQQANSKTTKSNNNNAKSNSSNNVPPASENSVEVTVTS